MSKLFKEAIAKCQDIYSEGIARTLLGLATLKERQPELESRLFVEAAAKCEGFNS